MAWGPWLPWHLGMGVWVHFCSPEFGQAETHQVPTYHVTLCPLALSDGNLWSGFGAVLGWS